MTLRYKDHYLLRLGSGLLDIAMMRRPWVVGVEVPGEGIWGGRHRRAAGVVPLEWWGAPGRRHAVRTVIKAMMAQLRPPVLLVLHGSHGHAASRVPWPSALFSPVTTDFRLFDCSTLNWSKSTRTPALHSVQMKVSEQHSSVEWRLGAMAVLEAAGSENLRDPSAMAASPSTEMALSMSSVGMGVPVVMTATGAVAVLPSAGMALSWSSVGMGVLVVMTATGAVAVLPSTEMALSLTSVGMGVLVVMTAAGSEKPRDSAATAVSPPAWMALSPSSVGMGVMTATGAVAVFLLTEMALSLSSVRMGVLVVMTAAGSENPRDPAAMAVSPPAGMALSLSSVGMGVLVVRGPSRPSCASIITTNDTVLSLSSRRWLFQQRWHEPMGPHHC